jgi:hypothetical protein
VPFKNAPDASRAYNGYPTQESRTKDGGGEGKGLDLGMLRRARTDLNLKRRGKMATSGVKPNLLPI